VSEPRFPRPLPCPAWIGNTLAGVLCLQHAYRLISDRIVPVGGGFGVEANGLALFPARVVDEHVDTAELPGDPFGHRLDAWRSVSAAAGSANPEHRSASAGRPFARSPCGSRDGAHDGRPPRQHSFREDRLGDPCRRRVARRLSLFVEHGHDRRYYCPRPEHRGRHSGTDSLVRVVRPQSAAATAARVEDTDARSGRSWSWTRTSRALKLVRAANRCLAGRALAGCAGSSGST